MTREDDSVRLSGRHNQAADVVREFEELRGVSYRCAVKKHGAYGGGLTIRREVNEKGPYQRLFASCCSAVGRLKSVNIPALAGKPITSRRA